MISVIVPVYNVEKYIRACLDSIINQTYRDLEIILVDDGSTDNSGAICDEYAKKDSRIKVIHKENGGQSVARNIGLQKAKGEFIGFVDSDDSIELDMFESLFSAIQNVDIAICGYNLVAGDKRIESGLLGQNKTLNQAELWKEIFGNLNNAVWNKLFRRELLSGICFDAKFAHGEDLIFNILYLKSAKTGKYINRYLYNYYKRGDSITTGKFTKRKLLEVDSKDEALRLVQEIYPTMTETAKKYSFRARMNIMRSIYKAKVEMEYKNEIQACEQYVDNHYAKIKNELRIKERIEAILYKYFKWIYKVFARYY